MIYIRLKYMCVYYKILYNSNYIMIKNIKLIFIQICTLIFNDK